MSADVDAVVARVVERIRTATERQEIQDAHTEDLLVGVFSFAYHLRAHGYENTSPRELIELILPMLPGPDEWDEFYANLVGMLAETP